MGYPVNWLDESDADGDSANPLDLEDIAGSFRPDGPVHMALGDQYESREQQQLVAREVASAFNDDAICLLEAPPGTGKTFAYLLPATRWALANDNGQVVVSTNTINLQTQIANTDLPVIRRVIGDELRVALVKGRGNYICPLRAKTVRTELTQGALYDDAGLSTLLDWAEQTRDGSKSDLDFELSDEAWEHISAESARCAWEQCQSSHCFFFKARKAISSAHLLVVNHAFLFSCLKGGDDAGVLPLGRVVIDEAHNIVDSATQCFSSQISNLDIHETLRRLRGAIARAATFAGKHKGEAKQALLDVRHTIPDTDIRTLEGEVKRVFDALAVAVNFARAKRITARDENWMEMSRECETLKAHMKGLCEQIDTALSDLGGAEGPTTSRQQTPKDTALPDPEGAEGVSWALKAAKRFLRGHIEAVEEFSESGDGDERVTSVRVEKKGRGVSVELSTAPLDIARHLQEKLYDQCRTVIMTSATLRVDGRFDFHKRSLGVERSKRLRDLAVSSPFQHHEQALLAMVTDDGLVPSETEDYVHRLAEAVQGALTAAGGGGLVLFTSWHRLKTVSDILAPRLKAVGITLLTQGDASRESLLARFKSDQRSVLFATDSFREGVDVVGDALHLVVITQLPFRVPTEPVFEARSEAMERKGDDAFVRYAVPLAVIHFRQAFGRLIRSQTDRGAVVVLDSRMATRFYGRRFLDAVPPCRNVRGSLETVTKEVEEFVCRGT